MTLALATCLAAQCKNADFPEAGGPTAIPARPVETYAADPIQVGVLQIESGWSHTWAGGSQLDTQSPMLRFGPWCNVEVRITSPVTLGGFGDALIGGQYRFVRESKRVPALAAGFTVKEPTAGDALGSGRRDESVTLMANKTIHGFALAANTSFFAIGRLDGGHDGKGEWSVAVSHTLRGQLGAIAEVYFDSRLNQSSPSYTNSTWALTYNVGRRIVIDSGAYVALSPGAASPGRSIFAGVTYSLANVYQHTQGR